MARKASNNKLVLISILLLIPLFVTVYAVKYVSTSTQSDASSFSNNSIIVSNTDVIKTLYRYNAGVDGLIKGSGFAITSLGATGFWLKPLEQTQGQGFLESTGGLIPGEKSHIHTYINKNKVNGTYKGSYILRYTKNGVERNGPKISYTIHLKDGYLLTNKNRVNVTLDKDDAQGGLIYGKGIILTSHGATSWQIKYLQPTQGQGFYESSGGINPGSTANIRTYINKNKSEGVYEGSAQLQYYYDGTWRDGDIIHYKITLQK